MKKIYMVLICILFVGSGVLADVVHTQRQIDDTKKTLPTQEKTLPPVKELEKNPSATIESYIPQDSLDKIDKQLVNNIKTCTPSEGYFMADVSGQDILIKTKIAGFKMKKNPRCKILFKADYSDALNLFNAVNHLTASNSVNNESGFQINHMSIECQVYKRQLNSYADVVLREQNRLLGKDYSKGPMFKNIIPLSSRYESFARSDKDVFYCADTHVYSN